MTGNGTTWSYTYDADGMRTSRSSGSTTYSYIYNGGQLTQMTVGSNTLLFTYDASGSPQTVIHNGTPYYYVTNLQGDVTAILNDSGDEEVAYTYDAWGNILDTSGDLASTLGALNPLRYRGYVYDTETQLYYLQSRYYNPEIGRFLNADALVATGQGLLGNNMFAYCRNNPVIRIDISGKEDAIEIDLDGNPITDDEHIGGGGGVSGGGTGGIVGGPGTGGNARNNDQRKEEEKESIDGGSAAAGRSSRFRSKLQKLSGQSGKGKHAHHMFPVKYGDKFKQIGIDINDPKNGAWWDAQSHLQNAPMYNQWWDIYFAAGNPTHASAMEFAKFLAWLYDLETYF